MTTGPGAAEVVVATGAVVVSALRVVKEVTRVVGFDSLVLASVVSSEVGLEADSVRVVSTVVSA